jgi:C-terminal processing protease CtpA/Prc
MRIKSILLLFCCSLLLSSCFKDNDDELQPVSALEIQNFIYRGLNFFYLYKADIPELADDAFANQLDLEAFLNSYETPEALFEYLQSPQDEFSILVDDYIALEDALSGVTQTNGMEFGLVNYPDGSGNVFGYVRYVLPGSDADNKGIERGIIFNRVNEQQITDTNFASLFEPDSYSIGLADFDGETITPLGTEIALSKTIFAENPIHVVRTFDIMGVKIGYLMYNAFTNEFDPELNNVFAQFKSEGVTELVLDLRYNSGGSVETANDLSSMITGQFNGQVFYQEIWNDDRQDEYAEDGLFNNQIGNGEAINSLNLTNLYVLTTRSTASASELVINGLDPYINVVKVGGTTRGKFQASFLLYDAPAPTFSRSQANPNHTYAMLPLVFKTANANGRTDFVNGLDPDLAIGEDFANLGVLGDPNEPLLAAALNLIVPTAPPAPTLVREEVGIGQLGDITDGRMVARTPN